MLVGFLVGWGRASPAPHAIDRDYVVLVRTASAKAARVSTYRFRTAHAQTIEAVQA